MVLETKYKTLLNVLDRIRDEAPPEFIRYHPSEAQTEALNQARSRAFIHLYLKVTYGILDFKKRETCITDDSGDGGIDAYYIDEEQKRIDIIQAKFRITPTNFHEKQIAATELLQMDVDRITEGETASESGQAYNKKIKAFQKALRDIADIGRYKYEVVILANLKSHTPSVMRKLTGGFPATVFDYQRTYDELLFPVVSGTYYNQPTLCIALDLSSKRTSAARVNYSVDTSFTQCEISLLFVPTEEIGRILHQYKNSILKYNPRSYLELQGNIVNAAIAETIENRTTNEFALFNNGITMLSDSTGFSENVGAKDQAQIVLTNPQVLNGGQTAFTLSRLYQRVIEGDLPKDVFHNKEVLLKVITFSPSAIADDSARLQLIEEISYATNSQTAVIEADRRANDKIQIDMQTEIFERFGYYYERKRGEFADGVREGYLQRSQIINREEFFRVCMACDLRPSQARRTGSTQLFRKASFAATLKTTDRVDEYFFAYKCFEALNAAERNSRKDDSDPFGTQKFGYALRYGKFAVVAVSAPDYANFPPEEATQRVLERLMTWLDFEEYAIGLARNEAYFPIVRDPKTGREQQILNFDGYYKGRTINADLAKFFLDTAVSA